MRTASPSLGRVARFLAVVVAVAGASSLATAAAPVRHAGSRGGVATTEAAVATEAVLTTAAFAAPPGNPVRTTALLTVPAGATWAASPGGALVLTVAAGTLRVALDSGFARVAHPPDPTPGARPLRELAEGESLVLRPGDRLVMHGHGSVAAQNIGRATAFAAVIRVL